MCRFVQVRHLFPDATRGTRAVQIAHFLNVHRVLVDHLSHSCESVYTCMTIINGYTSCNQFIMYAVKTKWCVVALINHSIATNKRNKHHHCALTYHKDRCWRGKYHTPACSILLTGHVPFFLSTSCVVSSVGSIALPESIAAYPHSHRYWFRIYQKGVRFAVRKVSERCQNNYEKGVLKGRQNSYQKGIRIGIE